MLTFSTLAASIDILRPYVKQDQCFTISPDALHASIATPSSADAERLKELGWTPSAVHPGVWDISPLSE
jgi:hypothetical protein